MKVFLSYSRSDASVAETVADDIRRLGHAVWYDREVSGGQAWWASILQEIRGCDLFTFIMTVKSLESEACVAEYTYASQLRKRILPVLCREDVRVNLLPPALSAIQFVDYRAQDKQAAFALVKAFDGLPPPTALPDPLPAEPPVPISYLGGLRMQIVSERELSLAEQSALLVEIRQGLKDPDSLQDALDLLRQLRARKDLRARVADEIDATIGDGGLARERSRSQQPQPTPAAGVSATPAPPAAERSGMGRRLLRWALYGFLALMGLSLAAQLFSNRAHVVPLPPQTGQLWCCDVSGFKRCPMAMPGPVGSYCVCPGQGTGVTCM
jgi:hypothetical protein